MKTLRSRWGCPMQIHRAFTFRKGRTIRHDEPFAKRIAGKLRRQTRQFRLAEKELRV